MEALLVSVINTQDQVMMTTNRMTMPLLQGVGDIDVPQSDNGQIPPVPHWVVMNFTTLLAHALLNIYSAAQLTLLKILMLSSNRK